MLLTSLIEAADRVDSTCGVQMAYLKRWAPRAGNPLELREPEAVAGPAGEVGLRRCQPGRGRPGRDRSGLRRPALQPALLPRQLPRVGDAGARRPARALRRCLQASRLPHSQEPLQLPPRGVDGARGPARARLDPVDRRLGVGRGLPRSRRRCREAAASEGTSPPLRSTSSATWAPRSASTTPPASGSGGCRTCATPSGCSSAVPTARRCAGRSSRLRPPPCPAEPNFAALGNRRGPQPV